MNDNNKEINKTRFKVIHASKVYIHHSSLGLYYVFKGDKQNLRGIIMKDMKRRTNLRKN